MAHQKNFMCILGVFNPPLESYLLLLGSSVLMDLTCAFGVFLTPTHTLVSFIVLILTCAFCILNTHSHPSVFYFLHQCLWTLTCAFWFFLNTHSQPSGFYWGRTVLMDPHFCFWVFSFRRFEALIFCHFYSLPHLGAESFQAWLWTLVTCICRKQCDQKKIAKCP